MPYKNKKLADAKKYAFTQVLAGKPPTFEVGNLHQQHYAIYIKTYEECLLKHVHNDAVIHFLKGCDKAINRIRSLNALVNSGEISDSTKDKKLDMPVQGNTYVQKGYQCYIQKYREGTNNIRKEDLLREVETELCTDDHKVLDDYKAQLTELKKQIAYQPIKKVKHSDSEKENIKKSKTPKNESAINPTNDTKNGARDARWGLEPKSNKSHFYKNGYKTYLANNDIHCDEQIYFLCGFNIAATFFEANKNIHPCYDKWDFCQQKGFDTFHITRKRQDLLSSMKENLDLTNKRALRHQLYNDYMNILNNEKEESDSKSKDENDYSLSDTRKKEIIDKIRVHIRFGSTPNPKLYKNRDEIQFYCEQYLAYLKKYKVVCDAVINFRIGLYRAERIASRGRSVKSKKFDKWDHYIKAGFTAYQTAVNNNTTIDCSIKNTSYITFRNEEDKTKCDLLNKYKAIITQALKKLNNKSEDSSAEDISASNFPKNDLDSHPSGGEEIVDEIENFTNFVDNVTCERLPSNNEPSCENIFPEEKDKSISFQMDDFYNPQHTETEKMEFEWSYSTLKNLPNTKKRKRDEISNDAPNKEFIYHKMEKIYKDIYLKNKSFYTHIIGLHDIFYQKFQINKRKNLLFLSTPLHNAILQKKSISNEILKNFELPLIAITNDEDIENSIVTINNPHKLNIFSLCRIAGNQTQMTILYKYFIDHYIETEEDKNKFLWLILKEKKLNDDNKITLLSLTFKIQKINPNIIDEDGNTLLHHLAREESKTQIKLFNFILDNCLLEQIDDTLLNNEGKTLLYLFIVNPNQELLASFTNYTRALFYINPVVYNPSFNIIDEAQSTVTKPHSTYETNSFTNRFSFFKTPYQQSLLSIDTFSQYDDVAIEFEDEINPLGILKTNPIHTVYLFVPKLIKTIMCSEDISEAFLPDYQLPIVALKNNNMMPENIFPSSDYIYINALMASCYYNNLANIKLLTEYHLKCDGSIDNDLLNGAFLIALKSPAHLDNTLIEIYELFMKCNFKIDISYPDTDGKTLLEHLLNNSESKTGLIDILSGEARINCPHFHKN